MCLTQAPLRLFGDDEPHDDDLENVEEESVMEDDEALAARTSLQVDEEEQSPSPAPALSLSVPGAFSKSFYAFKSVRRTLRT